MSFSNPLSLSIALPDGQIASQTWVNALLTQMGLNATVTPEQYGAAGDGVTNDAVALQAAFNSGKRVLLTKNYLVTTGIQYTLNRTIIEGIGDNAIISCDGAAVAVLLSPSATGLGRCALRNVKLLQTNATVQGVGLDTSDMPNFLADNVRIESFGTGHRVIDAASQSFYSRYTSLQIFNCNTGISVGGSQANQNTWYSARIKPMNGGGGTGIALSDARGCSFYSCDVEATAAAGITGISLDATTRECWFYNPWVEGCAVGISVASGVARSGVVGGSITANTTDISNSATFENFVFLGTNQSGNTLWKMGPFQWGTGSPIGAVSANAGTMFLRSDNGGSSPTMYLKRGGSGTTSGWVEAGVRTGTVSSISFASTNSYTQAVTFSSPFPTGVTPTVTTNINSAAGETAFWQSRAYSVSNTGFTLFLYTTGAGNAWTGNDVQWTAASNN